MVEVDVADGIATLRLASPQTANALTPEAFAELTRQVQAVQDEKFGARVLVLTGTGRIFSAGANLDVLGVTDPKTLARQINDALQPLQQALDDSRLPTIAAVNGTAVGGAVGLALMCDVVVAARSARFSLVFAKLGLIPDTGLTSTLPRLVGEARARALFMTGAEVTAEQAAAWGMIHHCAEDMEFPDAVARLAGQLAALPPGSQILTRRAVREGRNNSLQAQMTLEAQWQATRALSDEFRQAMAEFSARRRR